MSIPGTTAVLTVVLLIAGCAEIASEPTPRSPQAQRRPATVVKRVDPQQAERLSRVMVPLLRVMNNPRRSNEVRIGIVDDPSINAANAGGGEFYVTTGLLNKANEEQLRGVLAHEIAHDDLGHVAKAQILGTGLSLGVVLLEQLIPGSRAVTPIAGQLIARGYTRTEEYAADRHGVELLRRAGYPKEVMINTLAWIEQTEGKGNRGGGFFSTHPGTGDRIQALRGRG